MNDDREQRIREIAYYLWEKEGRPDEQAERHWAAAAAVVDAGNEGGEEETEEAGFDDPPMAVETTPIQPPAPVGKGRRKAEVGGV